MIDPWLEVKLKRARQRAMLALEASLASSGGRSYIGPKAQAAIPTELFLRAVDEAENRCCDLSDIWRELIIAGMVAKGMAIVDVAASRVRSE
jgi:hypothetical protein